MKRAKGEDGSKSMDRISKLPQEILHRILYFLSQKEVVRTSVLSKSWRYIWCTRPNLDFSDDSFKGNKQEFLFIVDNTLQRYCDQRLGVEEFHLRISLGDYLDHESVVSLIEKWIPTLTNMGMKKFGLSLPLEFQFRSKQNPRNLRLPPEVFGAESLQDLHVERFMLDQKSIQRIVPFYHLKELNLQQVHIEDEIFEKIISCCPLIETMRVEGCEWLKTVRVNDLHNLKHFYFVGMSKFMEEELCSIEIYPTSLENITIINGNLSFHKGMDFRNLCHLYLIRRKSSLDHMSSCKFPSLKYLFISNCDALKESQLFIDAPNILSFGYDGDFVPSISFATTLNEWRSNMCLTYRHPNNAPSLWLLKLKELLKSLSQSKISLNILQHPKNDWYIIEEDINLVQEVNGCDKPVVVESLSLRCRLSCVISSLLNGVLNICRPRNINNVSAATKGRRNITSVCGRF